MSVNTGGPAFPVIGAPGAPEDYPGMTLRDYFAAKAMQGIVASISQACPLDVPSDVRLAYEIADSMLAARSTEAK